ncbi:MAG: hypothetical protein ACRYHQ_15465 [Janthinobacterium lividum]
MDDLTLLTRREAAARVRLGYSTFVRLLTSQRGPTVTYLGDRGMIRADHLAQWVEQSAEHRPEPVR